MKIVAVVPMKLNNERLPHKNIKEFLNGKPLCYYILNTLLSINNIDEIYVYCSDDTITEHLHPNIKFLKRSNKLDTNDTKMNEILTSFSKDVEADIYVMTHTTAPFISANSIKKGLEQVKNGSYDSSFAVKKVQNFFWKDNKPFNYTINNIPRTQDLEPLYEETSGFYIYKKEVIRESGSRIGNKPYICEVSKIESIDIDDGDDFKIANAIYNFLFLKENENE